MAREGFGTHPGSSAGTPLFSDLFGEIATPPQEKWMFPVLSVRGFPKFRGRNLTKNITP